MTNTRLRSGQPRSLRRAGGPFAVALAALVAFVTTLPPSSTLRAGVDLTSIQRDLQRVVMATVAPERMAVWVR